MIVIIIILAIYHKANAQMISEFVGSLGADCTNLGITLTNSSLISPFLPYSPPSSSNNRDASSFGKSKHSLLIREDTTSSVLLNFVGLLKLPYEQIALLPTSCD